MKLTRNKVSGRIYARLSTGNPAQPYQRMTLGTKSLAEAKKIASKANLKDLESAMRAGKLGLQAASRLALGKKASVDKLFEQWVDAAPNRGESEATTNTARAVGKQWFACVPNVPKLAPNALGVQHIAPFINRTDADVGSKRRERQLAVLRQFCRYLVDIGAAIANPARLTKVDHRALSHTQRESKVARPFTEAELDKLLARTTGWWRWASGIANAAGLRLGDVATLEHATLSVPGHIVVWTDKRDRRVCLPVNEEVTPGLARILSEIPPTDSPYLFPEQAERYADVKKRAAFSIEFGRLLTSLDIEGVSFHSLRHTAITRWDRIGFSLDQCREFAGHTTTKTTKGYVHA